VLSLLLLAHVAAVFIPPFTFATSTGVEASPLASSVHQLFRPYVQFCYLDHGYFFFAPNPGATHLLRCDVQDGQGESQQVWIPDLEKQSPPRLFYHRHFMIAESLNAGFAAPQPSPESAGQPEQLASWRRRRALYEQRLSAIEDFLKRRYDARQVEVTRVEHRPPSPYEFIFDRVRLSDQLLYRDLPEDGSGGARP
jgi:hypothetical protein